MGFFISDHPLNQYKSIFTQYNILSFDEFESNNDNLSSNIACTVLKNQEKKTQKGNSYAIIKFSDLSTVFELFIFSEIFEMNRDLLVEGNSLMITLIKSYNEAKTQRRINVKKIVSLQEVINKPLENVTFECLNLADIDKLKSLSKKDGNTRVKILYKKDKEELIFELKDKRKLDNKLINLLNLTENVVSQ